MSEAWQLYDEQGRVKEGMGACPDEIYGNGLLHAASHVWIWRRAKSGPEILLQLRTSNKKTWPDCYDISAAGHIDLGESPVTAAIRETAEEIGIKIEENNLSFVAVHRAHLVADNGAIENELQWIFSFELTEPADFELQKSEVASLKWKALDKLKSEIDSEEGKYVPHGKIYFDIVSSAIELASINSSSHK